MALGLPRGPAPHPGSATCANPSAPWQLFTLALALFIVVDKLATTPSPHRSAAGSSRNIGAGTSLGGRARALTEDDAPAANATDANATDDHAAGHTEAHGGDHAAEHAHPHEAMFFMVFAITVGTLVLQLSNFSIFRVLQQTVVLFVLGCACSVVVQGLGLADRLGAVGRSYSMWVVIDPHLLLFTLLPPLLAGDAMSIDTNVAMKVSSQCLYMAGPGVLANAMLTAVFLWAYLPYDWPFLLCLTTGAILCATDPVAVVALLKELGASPVLTVQIQGESLLNDGTAMVLYMVAYSMLTGVEYSNEDIVIVLMKTALFAWVFGMIVGGLFFFWIRAAKNKHDHNSGIIQVSLTLVCAYSSFILAEGVLHISGVLSTVAASLVLAHCMWPEVACHKMMHTVWHMIESIGNTILFFLAGVLTGNIMARIPLEDYLHLLVIYVVLTVVRLGLLLASLPLLQRLHADGRPVSVRDALVMAWGGLRGAVGLALAIQVNIDRADGELSTLNADRVLFYVGGIAFLTLVINATTCPVLVRVLGITQVPEGKQMVMRAIHQQLVNLWRERKDDPAEVQGNIDAMLRDIELHALHQPDGKGRKGTVAITPRTSARTLVRTTVLGRLFTQTMESPQHIILKHAEARERLSTVRERFPARLVGLLPPSFWLDDSLAEVLRTTPVDPTMARAVTEAFLSLLRSQYWHQIEHGMVSTNEANLLFQCVASAQSGPCYDLTDFDYLYPEVNDREGLLQGCGLRPSSRGSSRGRASQPPCAPILESLAFQLLIMCTILADIVFVFIEYYWNPEDDMSLGWFLPEIIFTSIFTVEFLMKLADQRSAYFRDSWNVFEFVLVLVGLVGVGTHFFSEKSTTLGAKESQLVRIIRILKALRILRFFRLIRVARAQLSRVLGIKVSSVLAEHMRKFEILCCFIRGHIGAQGELLKYFGREYQSSTGAVARCLLQSQVAVYKALLFCAFAEQHLDQRVLSELHTCQKSIAAAEALEDFIHGAQKGGVLNTSDAEMVLHTMHDHAGRFARRVADIRLGRVGGPAEPEGAPPADGGEEGSDRDAELVEEAHAGRDI